MKVFLSTAARQDVSDIGEHIAADNPERAQTFVNDLLDRAEALGASPKLYPLLPGREAHGIRRRLHGSYLIFFRIEPDQVTIPHILHGARDYESLLFPDA